MLKLAQLTLRNFRSIKEETFMFQSLSVLIGQNNAGKSNVLDAVSILLEGTSKDVTPQEFFSPDNDFAIEGVFSDIAEHLEALSPQHKPRVEACIDGNGAIKIRRIGSATEHSLSQMEMLNPTTGAFNTPTGIDAALK